MFDLAESLKNHKPFNAMENTHRLHTLGLLRLHRHNIDGAGRCFHRDYFTPGHVVGSAFVASPDFRKVLMIMHPVIKQWVMPGGHSDGDENSLAVAHREVEEETGLTPAQLGVWNGNAIFDVDTHQYPANAKKNEPEHIHFDIRFLFTHAVVPIVSPEGHETKWFTLEDAEGFSPPDGGRYRCIQKLKKLATP